MKTITFILQSKGGVGKSAFVYLLANKYNYVTEFVVVDMDNETNTAVKQTQFVKTLKHNLIDSKTKNIDRAAFDNFLEDFINTDKITSAICDCGATTSEQFLVFLQEAGTEILKSVIEMNINVQICCVVPGLNAFPASADYCRNLFKNIDIPEIKKYIVKNNYFEFSDEQNEALAKLAKVTNAKIQEFNIVPNNVPGTLKEVHALMEAGKSFDDAKTFTKIRVKQSIEEITIRI